MKDGRPFLARIMGSIFQSAICSQTMNSNDAIIRFRALKTLQQR